MVNIPVVLLAAGGSARMGRPKQLLPWGNQTLIEHQIQTLRKTGNPVCVVLGASASLISPVIEKHHVYTFINHDWQKGMGSSVAAGVTGATAEFPNSDAILVALSDQPLIPPEHFNNMLKTFRPGKKQIIISQSASGWNGVPALFDKWYFEELKELDGEQGAKTIIGRYKNAVISLNCSDNLADIDTPESYRQALTLMPGQKSQ